MNYYLHSKYFSAPFLKKIVVKYIITCINLFKAEIVVIFVPIHYRAFSEKYLNLNEIYLVLVKLDKTSSETVNRIANTDDS